MSLDLETPLGFASFLANSSNHRKVFVPSTFNMSKILTSISSQQSLDLVCDASFFEVELPEATAEEYKQKCSSVENVVVAGQVPSVRSSVFAASPTVIDPLTF